MENQIGSYKQHVWVMEDQIGSYGPHVQAMEGQIGSYRQHVQPCLTSVISKGTGVSKEPWVLDMSVCQNIFKKSKLIYLLKLILVGARRKHP